MDITNKLDKFLTEEEIEGSVDIDEGSELAVIAAALDKTMKELEKKKEASVKILMDFNRISKKIKKVIDKPIHEKFVGFGNNGTVETHGDTIVINKNGKSVELTKKELIGIILKLGLGKQRSK